MSRKRVAIIGATGYTGSELVRILVNHPEVEIAYITSESYTGKKFSEVHPAFRGICDKELSSASDAENADNIDVVFLALPHGVSMQYAGRFLEKGIKVIDLSADFRFNDKELYEKWYRSHEIPGWMSRAAYGMPEIYKEEIEKAQLIGNPGCFPTASLLAVLPVIEEGWVNTEERIIVDAKSGTTGAGVKPSGVTHFSSHFGNFFPYKTGHHRHQPEISHIVKRRFGMDSKVIFSPHLLPVDRGILSTVYVSLNRNCSQSELNDLYRDFYRSAPFVRVLDREPKVKEVRGSNYCDVFPYFHEESQTLQAAAAIDNLVKGASGAAVQNMNIMLGLRESEGLMINPLSP